MNLPAPLVRALKTAAQAFLAIEVGAGLDYLNVATVKAAAVAAGAALLSYLYNLVVVKPTEG